MRLVYATALAAALLGVSSTIVWAQGPPQGQPPAGGRAMGGRVGGPGSPTTDGSRAVTDGGIKVPGWEGKIDANEEKAGMTIKDALLAKEGDAIHMVSGPRSPIGGPPTKLPATTP